MVKDNQHLSETLKSLGLGEKEASVYVALLELGSGTVTVISRKAGINRTTGYDILASLAEKGLVNISGKEPKQEYVAESPDSFRVYLKKQIELAEQNLKVADSFIPELKSVHTTGNRPKIKFYEGTEGLKHVYEDTLNSTETIRAYASVEDVQSAIPNYFPEYFRRREAKGIHIRAIFPHTPAAVERHSHDVEEKRETAFVPADKYNFSPEINIYDNKVMIASWREKLGIIIESNEIADAMKKIYKLAWSEAKRIEKEL